MVKTVVAVIVGLVLLNTAWFVLKIVILIVAERREYEKYRYKSPYQSPHREAFIMECSDPNSSPYARQLDKCIKKMDREQTHSENQIEIRQETVEYEHLENFDVSEDVRNG